MMINKLIIFFLWITWNHLYPFISFDLISLIIMVLKKKISMNLIRSIIIILGSEYKSILNMLNFKAEGNIAPDVRISKDLIIKYLL